MALENWLEAKRLNTHKTTHEELKAIYGVIDRCFKDASLEGLSSDQKYILSYQAAFEAALALIYCYGYKPVKAGHHYVVWQCLKELLDKQDVPTVTLFENGAKKRSKLSYDMAGIVSNKESDEMYKEAREFVNLIKGEITKFDI